MNRAIKLVHSKSDDWDTYLYTPPAVVSAQEHSQMETRLDEWAAQLHVGQIVRWVVIAVSCVVASLFRPLRMRFPISHALSGLCGLPPEIPHILGYLVLLRERSIRLSVFLLRSKYRKGLNDVPAGFRMYKGRGMITSCGDR